jgi:hypothetical protein
LLNKPACSWVARAIGAAVVSSLVKFLPFSFATLLVLGDFDLLNGTVKNVVFLLLLVADWGCNWAPFGCVKLFVDDFG